METFCRGDVLCGDVLYVRQIDCPIKFSKLVEIFIAINKLQNCMLMKGLHLHLHLILPDSR
jgi:hypothetical protein